MSIFVVAMLLSVRPVDSLATEILDRAVAQSAVVRHLIRALDASNVIVHVQSSRQMPAGIGGMTRFVTARGGYRYLRVTIDASLPAPARIALLAHELQHACEIARSTADDADSLTRLFASAGRHDGPYFETRAAVEIERDVRRALRATPAGIGPRRE